jgi:murein DD-endopeptidase MepM/ murein hydrolase activator NlpD
MTIEQLALKFRLDVPIGKGDIIWNGQPGEFSNIGCNMSFTQKYGITPYSQNTGIYKPMLGHNGIDLAGDNGTPIIAPCKIFITDIGYDSGYGNRIFAETETLLENGEAYKLEFIFAHLFEIEIGAYKWRDVGSLIGLMGSTGNSTGSHLHFGIRPYKRQADGSFLQIFVDNGYRGYVNPELFIKQSLIFDKQYLINLNNMLKENEKKIIIEAEGAGRKGIIINGRLREIKNGREADACLYALANNKLGKVVSSKDFNNLPKDNDF